MSAEMSQLLITAIAVYAAIVSTFNWLWRERRKEPTPYWVDLPADRKVIVLKTSKPLTQEMCEKIRVELAKGIHSGKPIVLDKDIDISMMVI